jgi:hypothetical protein
VDNIAHGPGRAPTSALAVRQVQAKQANLRFRLGRHGRGGHSKNGPEAPSVQRTNATLQSVVDTQPAFQNPETEWIDDPGDKPAKTRSVLRRLVRGSAIAACQCMTLGL